MLYTNTKMAAAVAQQKLPSTFDELFEDLYDHESGRFLTQETTILDFKETISTAYTDSYGASIVRLAISFFNTYGGLIVFGVKDRLLEPVGDNSIFDIEFFNRSLSDFTGHAIECSMRRFDLLVEDIFVTITVVLVPRRGNTSVAALVQPLDKYKVGTCWVRDRHEVLEASTRHLPLLYSTREFFDGQQSEGGTTIHRSLPPSPSTMQDFVGRLSLMRRLWDWLIFGNAPRVYLHGPGGSGKSTLAYELARSMSDSGQSFRFSNGDRIDYVVFLSGKETAFNTLTQMESDFALREFSTAREQFIQILLHVGLLSEHDAQSIDDEQIDILLEEMSNNFSGLIVIDDIDALSRRQVPTGEEELFLKFAKSRARTRIIYTLRYAPGYALSSALEVPGLDPDTEFYEFVELCCRQFDVPPPGGQFLPRISEETSQLPLLIETLVGLRRSLTNYSDAIQAFHSRGGEAARRYLYQREYDRLSPSGRSRQTLAALGLIDAAVPYRTLCDVLAPIPEEQIRDAISETKGIFLRTDTDTEGNIRYELAAPARGFVRKASEGLSYYGSISKSVEYYRHATVRMTMEQASAVARLTRLVREKEYGVALDFAMSFDEASEVRQNPRFIALLGQVYAASGAQYAEDARECFRRAYGLRERNIFMLRDWYYLEMRSPHRLGDAESLCRTIVDDGNISARHRSEFFAKLGQVLDLESRSHVYTNPDRAIDLLKRSIDAYFQAAWVGKGAAGIDEGVQEEWLSGVIGRLFSLIRNDPEPIFSIIEGWASLNHDVSMRSAKRLIEPLRAISLSRDETHLARTAGLCRRAISKLSKLPKRRTDEEGFSYVLHCLRDLAGSLDERARSLNRI